MNRVEFERQFWDEKAKSKNVAREMHDPEINTQEEVDYLLKNIPSDVENVLEIGCGIGRLAIPIANRLRTATIFGMDISTELLFLAAKKAKKEADGVNTLFYTTNGRTIGDPFGMGKQTKYDFIYSVTVFQHIAFLGVSNYIFGVGDKLNKGGVFRFQFIEGTEKEPMSWHFNLKAIKELLDWAGLKVTKYDKGFIYPNWTWITAKKL